MSAAVKLKEAPINKVIKQVRFWQAVYIGSVPTNFVNNPKFDGSRLGNNLPSDMELSVVDGGIEIYSKSKKEIVFVSYANIGSIVFVVE